MNVLRNAAHKLLRKRDSDQHQSSSNPTWRTGISKAKSSNRCQRKDSCGQVIIYSVDQALIAKYRREAYGHGMDTWGSSSSESLRYCLNHCNVKHSMCLFIITCSSDQMELFKAIGTVKVSYHVSVHW